VRIMGDRVNLPVRIENVRVLGIGYHLQSSRRSRMLTEVLAACVGEAGMAGFGDAF